MAKTLFDHFNAIFKDKRVSYFSELEDGDKKTYQTYMINRLISMNPEWLPIANEVNLFGTLKSRESYLFYSQLLPKGKFFFPYIKRKTTTVYDLWLIETVAKYFEISKWEAEEYIDILVKSEEGKEELRYICDFYATDPKIMKKSKIWNSTKGES